MIDASGGYTKDGPKNRLRAQDIHKIVDAFNKRLQITFNFQSTKVHLACWNGYEHPIDVYFAGQFQAWQEHQTKRNFGCDHVLSLIDLGQSRWVFVGIYD